MLIEFLFSKHSLEQMELRNISKDKVVNILKNPDQVIENNETNIFQPVILENEKKYLIRVFVNNNKSPNVIITVYKT